MGYYQLERSQVQIPVSQALEMNKNVNEYAWLAQYRPTEVKNISGSKRFAQVSGMSRTR
jgi:hypothetical protein